MWTKQEQELLCEEVGQRWLLLLHLKEQYDFGEPEIYHTLLKKIERTEQLFHILDSGDDLSFHYKNPSDYNLLITIVEELDSELKERILQKIERERDGKMFTKYALEYLRILQKIERERDGKMFTKYALEYLRKQFEEMNDIKKRGERYLGVHPQTLVVIVYIRDHDDVNETEEDILYRVEQALRKHDYDPEELLKDEEDVLKLYNEVK